MCDAGCYFLILKTDKTDISDGLLHRLQSVQNACLVTGARRADRITAVLLQLHWLPVRQ